MNACEKCWDDYGATAQKLITGAIILMGIAVIELAAAAILNLTPFAMFTSGPLVSMVAGFLLLMLVLLFIAALVYIDKYINCLADAPITADCGLETRSLEEARDLASILWGIYLGTLVYAYLAFVPWVGEVPILTMLVAAVAFLAGLISLRHSLNSLKDCAEAACDDVQDVPGGNVVVVPVLPPLLKKVVTVVPFGALLAYFPFQLSLEPSGQFAIWLAAFVLSVGGFAIYQKLQGIQIALLRPREVRGQSHLGASHVE